MSNSNVIISTEFKSQATKSIFAVLLFVVVYIALLLSAMGLTVLCCYGAYLLVVAHPSIITLFLGFGLASMGFLVLFFLIKFLFQTHKIDRSHLTEIVRQEEPKLFSMIEDIVAQVDTTMPKRVYLSSELNASVFYDSNFWSMIFPVRKNLQIGLALVNVLTIDELRGILAHEFGHFSQKSMKVGSYVYNLNHIIYNMLYENESYDKFANKLAGGSGYITLFVVVAIKIVQAIQWILRLLYSLINKAYMGLSREMEFHADEIAANVTGAVPIKNALLRMDLADHSFNAVLGFYDAKVSMNMKTKNLYEDQSFVMNYFASARKIPIENGLPQISLNELNKFNKSKLIIDNQWASHPSTEDRVKKIEETTSLTVTMDNGKANDVFLNITDVQNRITDALFKNVEFSEAPIEIEHLDFQIEFEREAKQN